MTLEDKQKIFKYIDEMNKDLMKLENHSNVVSEIIKKLNKFIYTKYSLSEKDINELLSILVKYRIVLDIPIPIDTLLLRAVKIDEETTYPSYDNASRISYIPDEISSKAPLGRFNMPEQPMYYGTIATSDKNINVPLSEVEAKEGEFINILISKTTKELRVRYIGLFEYYKKGEETPFEINPFFKEVYEYYQNIYDKDLLIAIELCDEFFTRITTEKITIEIENKRLYSITSLLSRIFLADSHVDGLIYPSVATNGFPNIVLKPKSVDNKVEHKKARILLIKEDYGKSVYYVIDFDDIGEIDNKNNITWKNKNNN